LIIFQYKSLIFQIIIIFSIFFLSKFQSLILNLFYSLINLNGLQVLKPDTSVFYFQSNKNSNKAKICRALSINEIICYTLLSFSTAVIDKSLLYIKITWFSYIFKFIFPFICLFYFNLQSKLLRFYLWFLKINLLVLL
jgi:hypothetical protein